MKAPTTLFWTMTTGFWLVVAPLAWAAQGPGAATPVAPGIGPAAAAPLIAERTFDLDALARHNHAGDCWMAIGGVVYGLTGYLPLHPTAPAVLLPWCGKNATAVYLVKPGTGRPHSAMADDTLARFRVGAFKNSASR